MNRIYYQISQEEEGPLELSLPWSEENMAHAEAYALAGTIRTAEDGAAETPSALDRLEAQMTYTAMMTGTLLEVKV